MRFLLSLMAGLVLVGVAPIAASQAAPVAYSTSSAGASSQPAQATFGAGPASAAKIDGRPYFAYETSPGGGIEDHIAVINFSGQSQRLNVYAVDASTGRNGDFVYAARAAARTEVGAWLTVDGPGFSGELTVGPHDTVIVPFALHIPANAAPGDHAGAIIVSLTSLAESKNGKQRVKLEQRIATRVIIRVSGPLHPGLTIEDLHASYTGHLNPFAAGEVTVTYTVRNSGNVLLGGTQQVSAHGWFGSSSQAAAVPAVPLLLPGGSYPVVVHLHGLIPEIGVSVNVKLTPAGLPGEVNPGLHAATASVTLWAVPWLLVLLLLAVVILIVVLVWRRRRWSRWPVTTGASPTPEGVKQ
jgi:hypothetical protein